MLSYIRYGMIGPAKAIRGTRYNVIVKNPRGKLVHPAQSNLTMRRVHKLSSTSVGLGYLVLTVVACSIVLQSHLLFLEKLACAHKRRKGEGKSVVSGNGGEIALQYPSLARSNHSKLSPPGSSPSNSVSISITQTQVYE